MDLTKPRNKSLFQEASPLNSKPNGLVALFVAVTMAMSMAMPVTFRMAWELRSGLSRTFYYGWFFKLGSFSCSPTKQYSTLIKKRKGPQNGPYFRDG